MIKLGMKIIQSNLFHIFSIPFDKILYLYLYLYIFFTLSYIFFHFLYSPGIEASLDVQYITVSFNLILFKTKYNLLYLLL